MIHFGAERKKSVGTLKRNDLISISWGIHTRLWGIFSVFCCCIILNSDIAIDKIKCQQTFFQIFFNCETWKLHPLTFNKALKSSSNTLKVQGVSFQKRKYFSNSSIIKQFNSLYPSWTSHPTLICATTGDLQYSPVYYVETLSSNRKKFFTAAIKQKFENAVNRKINNYSDYGNTSKTLNAFLHSNIQLSEICGILSDEN